MSMLTYLTTCSFFIVSFDLDKQTDKFSWLSCFLWYSSWQHVVQEASGNVYHDPWQGAYWFHSCQLAWRRRQGKRETISRLTVACSSCDDTAWRLGDLQLRLWNRETTWYFHHSSVSPADNHDYTKGFSSIPYSKYTLVIDSPFEWIKCEKIPFSDLLAKEDVQK